MFDFDAALFWYKLIFLTELIVAEGFATYTLKRRNNFVVRIVLSVIVVYALAFLFPVFFVSQTVNAVTTSVMFLLLFMFTVIAMKICYDERFVTIFFCAIVAYTTQHIAYSTYAYLLEVTGISEVYVYGDMSFKSDDPFTFIVYFAVYAIIYWFVWAFIEHKMREQEKLEIEPLLLWSFAAILSVDIVLNAVAMYFMTDYLNEVGQTVLYLYRLMSTLFVYIVLYSVLGKKLAEHELETVESLWQQDRRSFEFSKENIDLINIKVHDLKHQIRRLGAQSGSIDPSYLAELERSVSIYDNSIKTGNEALDLLFAEKSIYLQKHKIRISVMADGAALSFMANADIYSLFGNVMNNAAEALSQAEEEKRLFRLYVRRQGQLISVHAENYCNGVLLGQDGLPKTTKTERGHGYGMRSMRLIAEKYGGDLTVEVKDSIFSLDIIIPVQKERESSLQPVKEERKVP